MRAIPLALQAKLDTGVTTLCRCWKLIRQDGVIFGFTDHDEDLDVADQHYRAGTGFDGAELAQKLGLAVGGTDLAGALSDEALSEKDLAAGRWDGARLELRLVDWSDPTLFVLLSAGHLGEVSRAGAAFTVEVRGLAAKLAIPTGRRYSPLCDADLGDSRCGKALNAPQWTAEGTVHTVSGEGLLGVDGLSAYEEGWFTHGRLTWMSGANIGLSTEIRLHRRTGTQDSLSLWDAPPEPVSTGDGFRIEAGCDKRFETCTVKFSNHLNFRGCPHIPGNDFAMSYAVSGDPDLNGGPRR